MNEQDTKRKLSNLRSMLTRRAKRKNIPTPYQCFGGPFDGLVIYLETASTGSFRVGEMLGRYVSKDGMTYRTPREAFSNIQWEVSA